MGKNYKNYNSNDEFVKDMEAPVAEEAKEEVAVEEVKPEPAPAPAPKKEKKAEPKKVSGGPARI